MAFGRLGPCSGVTEVVLALGVGSQLREVDVVRGRNVVGNQ